MKIKNIFLILGVITLIFLSGCSSIKNTTLDQFDESGNLIKKENPTDSKSAFITYDNIKITINEISTIPSKYYSLDKYILIVATLSDGANKKWELQDLTYAMDMYDQDGNQCYFSRYLDKKPNKDVSVVGESKTYQLWNCPQSSNLITAKLIFKTSIEKIFRNDISEKFDFKVVSNPTQQEYIDILKKKSDKIKADEEETKLQKEIKLKEQEEFNKKIEKEAIENKIKEKEKLKLQKTESLKLLNNTLISINNCIINDLNNINYTKSFNSFTRDLKLIVENCFVLEKETNINIWYNSAYNTIHEGKSGNWKGFEISEINTTSVKILNEELELRKKFQIDYELNILKCINLGETKQTYFDNCVIPSEIELCKLDKYKKYCINSESNLLKYDEFNTY